MRLPHVRVTVRRKTPFNSGQAAFLVVSLAIIIAVAFPATAAAKARAS